MSLFRKIQWFYVALLSFVAMGCNHDVFVDRPDLEGDVSVKLSEYSSERVPYSYEGLQEFVIYHIDICDNVVYDLSGNPVDTIRGASVTLHPGEVSRVDIARKAGTVTVDFTQKDIIEVYIGENFSKKSFEVSVTLQYASARRTIDIEVLPGEPLNVLYYDYANPDDCVVDFSTAPVSSVTYNNESDNNINVTLYPYQHAESSVNISIHNGGADIIDFNTAPPVWLYTANQFGDTMLYGEVPLINGLQPIPSDQRPDTEETYMLPPKSTFRFKFTVRMARTVSEFGIVAGNSSTTVRFDAFMTVVEPVDYAIEYERID